MTVKLLIDECLHTSLVEVAHGAGHLADHVNYLGLGSSKDWQLMATILQQDYTFVTNNRSDFLSLHGQEPLHAGVIIIVLSVAPARQRELFSAARADHLSELSGYAGLRPWLQKLTHNILHAFSVRRHSSQPTELF